MKLKTISHLPVSILGLAISQDMDVQCIPVALAVGINYLWFYNLSAISNTVEELKRVLSDQRQDVMIATGSESRNFTELKTYLAQVRHQLEIEQVDIFFLEYISPTDDLTEIKTLLDELTTLKKQDLIRYLGVSTHNRELAIALIESGQIDVLMHRYNMAHRQAEKQVFPTAIKTATPAIAFTCTRWGTLLKGHPQWQERIPTAADCYRYALANEAINLALTAPKTLAQLQDNLQVLHHFQLTSADKKLWQSYGDLIYGSGQDTFETQWL